MVNDAYTNELVRLPLLWDSPTARVTSLGSAVQHQVAPLSPAPQHAGKFAVWVAASLGPLANQTFTIDSAGEARHGRGQAPFALPPRHPALRPHSAPATDTGPVPAAQQREAAGFSDAASVTRKGSTLLLQNGQLSVQLPAAADAGSAVPPAPLLGLRAAGAGAGQDLGASHWRTNLTLQSFSAVVDASGPLFARVTLAYVFHGTVAVTESAARKTGAAASGCNSRSTAFVNTTVQLDAFASAVRVADTGCLAYGDAWQIELTAGLATATAAAAATGTSPPRPVPQPAPAKVEALLQQTHTCDIATAGDFPAIANLTALQRYPLQPSRRWGRTLGMFGYRWNQGCDMASIAVASNGRQGLAAMVARGGQWAWPHGRGFGFADLANGKTLPTLLLQPSSSNDNGSALLLHLPLGAGHVVGPRGGAAAAHVFDLAVVDTAPAPAPAPAQRRRAAAAPALPVGALPALQRRRGQVPLDKLLNDYLLDSNSTCDLPNFMATATTDPTNIMRALARGIVKGLDRGQPPPLDLCRISAQVDPDWYGLYRGNVSPENNNFATDFMRVPLLLMTATRSHAEAARFRQLAQQLVDMDLFYSVALPSGAGAESPGYTLHAMNAWIHDARYYATYFGFDTRQSPRLQAAARFLLRTSQPFASHFVGAHNASLPGSLWGRFILPLGDTHPRPEIALGDLPSAAGINVKPVAAWESEELQGFGAVLRDRPGTLQEAFVAFKASPHRGHNHGDQLSFHFCAAGRRHAIDLMFGYNPRPLEEAWHNRVSFGSSENMDGYERLLAFRPGRTADVVVGDVASSRLRQVPDTPPGIYAAAYPFRAVDIYYRRTLVLVHASASSASAGGAASSPAGGLPYVVVLDQYNASQPVAAALNYFFEQEGSEVFAALPGGGAWDLGNATLGMDSSASLAAAVASRRWTNTSEGQEHATGVRLASRANSTSGVFVSVVYPSGSLEAPAVPVPAIACNASAGEAMVGAGRLRFSLDAESPRVTFQALPGGEVETLLQPSDLDFGRSQGDIGLTVTDTGYDFGPAPDWVLQQRTASQSYLWPLNPRFAVDAPPQGA